MTVALIASSLLVGSRMSVPRIIVTTALVAVATKAPMVAMSLGGVVGLYWLNRRGRARLSARESHQEDVAAFADLLALGLTGGLGVHQAMQAAAGAIGGVVADEVSGLLRVARVDGMAVAAAHNDGVGRSLYREIGRAMVSGASLLDQVARVADDLHATLTARRLEKLRRVPVAMLFPLTLLILPGFLLLTVAPAVLDAFSRLEM